MEADKNISIFYTTRDGHTATIAERITNRINDKGINAQAVNLADIPLSIDSIRNEKLFILISSLRFGFHEKPADDFLQLHKTLDTPIPLVLASVNLTARKPNKNTAETNPYLRKWIKRKKLNPVLAKPFAGKLDYPKYKTWEKLAIKLIMTITGGETDTTKTVIYTDWNEVDKFADDIASLYL